jgi:hypothetical protein
VGRLAKKRPRARGEASFGMAGQIFRPSVGFGLDNPGDPHGVLVNLVNEEASNECPGDNARVALEPWHLQSARSQRGQIDALRRLRS